MCMQYRFITHFSCLLNSNEWKEHCWVTSADFSRVLCDFCIVDDLRDF